MACGRERQAQVQERAHTGPSGSQDLLGKVCSQKAVPRAGIAKQKAGGEEACRQRHAQTWGCVQ